MKTSDSVITFYCFFAFRAFTMTISLNPMMCHILWCFLTLDVCSDTGCWCSLYTSLVHRILADYPTYLFYLFIYQRYYGLMKRIWMTYKRSINPSCQDRRACWDRDCNTPVCWSASTATNDYRPPLRASRGQEEREEESSWDRLSSIPPKTLYRQHRNRFLSSYLWESVHNYTEHTIFIIIHFQKIYVLYAFHI